mgnify:CR=1 FL=1
MSVETMFNSRATLQTRTRKPDAFGGTTETFAVGDQFPCRIQPSNADETNLYSREGATVTAKAYVSASLVATIIDRVKFGTRTFLIRGVVNPDEADVYKILYLEEQP